MTRSLCPLVTALACLAGPLGAGCGAAEPARVDPDGPTGGAAGETGPSPFQGSAKEALQRHYRELALENRCPGGYGPLQGEWWFIGTSKTPSYTDQLEVKGTRFVELLDGEPDGKRLSARLEGELRCLFKNRVLMTFDKVEPPGAYENHAGDSFPCDSLETPDGKHDRVLLICFFDWDMRPEKGLEFAYGRKALYGPGGERHGYTEGDNQ